MRHIRLPYPVQKTVEVFERRVLSEQVIWPDLPDHDLRLRSCYLWHITPRLLSVWYEGGGFYRCRVYLRKETDWRDRYDPIEYVVRIEKAFLWFESVDLDAGNLHQRMERQIRQYMEM